MNKEQLGVMRARIEAELNAPAALVVTSACIKDGKSLVASSLAVSLSKAGRRVVLVDASDAPPGDRWTNSAPKLSALSNFDIASYVVSATAGEPDLLGLWSEGVADSSSGENVRAALTRLRERYEYIVVDTSPAQRSSLSLSLAAAAEATLLSLRMGRAASSSDRDLVGSLRSVGANIIGVVTTDSKTVSAFYNAQRKAAQTPGAGRRSLSDEGLKSGTTSVRASLVK